MESQTPLMASRLWFTNADWHFNSVPQKNAANRVLSQPRGKLLGGCSSINAMMYHRGPASDFDEWERLGNPGWNYNESLRYFKKSETFIDPTLPPTHPMGPMPNRVQKPKYEKFDPQYHGKEGPWQVSYQHMTSVTEGFVKGCEDTGIPFNNDFNATSTIGVNRVQTFIQRDGVRSSTARAFLGPEITMKDGKPRTDRGKVRIVFGAHITRVLIQKRRGANIAIGAEFIDNKHGQYQYLRMKRFDTSKN